VPPLTYAGWKPAYVNGRSCQNCSPPLTANLNIHTSGLIYFYHKFDRVIGYNEGKPTQWIRAELTGEGKATYQGHPTNLDEVRSHFPHIKE
jgi:hypothetical protein